MIVTSTRQVMDIKERRMYSRAMAVSQVMPASASRVERKRARNRDALIAAARKLFSEQGFEATTIAAIAEEADLGFGTFYRYFPDKEAILQAVLDLGKAEVDAVLAHPDNTEAGPTEALRGLTARFVRAVRKTHDVAVLFWKVGVIGTAGPGTKRMLEGELEPDRVLPAMLAKSIAAIIRRGIATGEFRQVDPVLSSRFIASAHMYLLGPTGMEHSERSVIETLCDFELRALSIDANTPQRKRKGSRR
jgi:AcrR family transcriptional regulator